MNKPTVETPLYAKETEMQLIGCTIVEPRFLEKLEPHLFFSKRHLKLFECMKYLDSKQEPIDEITIHQQLKRDGKLIEGQNGDIDYICDLTQNYRSTFNFDHFLENAKQYYIRRRLKELSTQLSDAAETQPVDETIDDFKKHFETLGHAKEFQSESFYDLFEKMLDNIGKKPEETETFKSGLAELDKLIKFFKMGEIDLIGARPAMGKTSLGLNLALRSAMTENLPTLIVSAEMTNMELAIQFTSIATGIPRSVFDEGLYQGKNLSEAHWDKVHSFAKRFKKMELKFDDTPNTPRRVLNSIEAHHTRFGIKCVILDYIQLINVFPDHANTRTSLLGAFANDLKMLAKRLNIHIMCLCQLNRQSEQRTDKRPMLSDLRDCGELEQVCYKCILIFRDEVYNELSSQKGVAELIVAKCRFGKPGIAKVQFQGENTKFNNLYKF